MPRHIERHPVTQTYKKKLIEVAIPLEAINAAAAREKSIRHGHPSTLHLWWARRPLAACRAVLFAQLVDDPSSLPDEFPTQEAQEAERKRLFAIIEDLVKWENSTNEAVLERARAEIRRSCARHPDGTLPNGDLKNVELPPVYDPFSGGGSIPLEAQRLGLPAYGSDLNPVAVMIGKAMIEIPPKFKDREPIHPGLKARQFYRNAEGLAEDIRQYGHWMREKAQERIGNLYPKVSVKTGSTEKEATVMAWIWARTVESPNPAMQGRKVPIVKSFKLGGKSDRQAWIVPHIDEQTLSYSFTIERTQNPKIKSTSGPRNATCLVTGDAIPLQYIRNEGKRGRLGRELLAIIAEGPSGKVYLPPKTGHAEIEESVQFECDLGKIEHWSGCTNCVVYGLDEFEDLHTERQLKALSTFSNLLDKVEDQIVSDALSKRNDDAFAKEYAAALRVYLGFAVSKAADKWNSMTSWDNSRQSVGHLFTRQAISMVWDYAETNPFSSSAGNWTSYINWIAKVVEQLVSSAAGTIFQRDAASQEDGIKDCVISTDPPYYDNVPYSNLSDFFYPWMKSTGRSAYPNLFSTVQVPKQIELVANQFRFGSKDAARLHFIEGMKSAMREMVKDARADLPATIYYAFKQSEIAREGISSTGWATFLQAVIKAGYAVVGTWPMRTEMANRMMAKGTNALANSVILVCRKKEDTAEVITRAEFIRALKRELPPAIAALQAANIAPADMPQSAIGPGMGVFSRCEAILEADDSPMSVKTALQLINAELDEFLNDVQGEFDDGTRFAITWFEQNGMGKGDYGAADNLARARGIAVESVKQAGIVESQAGKVRILKRDELDPDWEPQTDNHLTGSHLTIWKCLQYLVRSHETDGISDNSALLLKKIGDRAEAVKDLAYCLYDIAANRRQEAKEATAYNALIADWSELTRQAAAIHDIRGPGQTRMDL